MWRISTGILLEGISMGTLLWRISIGILVSMISIGILLWRPKEIVNDSENDSTDFRRNPFVEDFNRSSCVEDFKRNPYFPLPPYPPNSPSCEGLQ